MPMIRPSLTLVLDLDERTAGKETVLEIKRNYAHICTPVIRTHAAESEEAPAVNTMRMIVSMGTYRYLDSADEGADERWNDIVEPWIGNMLHKVGNNMKVFNDRQRAIHLPEIVFDRVDVEMGSSALVVGLHPDPESKVAPSLKTLIGLARTLRNDGTLANAIRIDVPTEESYETQCEQARAAWDVEHPDKEEEENVPGCDENSGEPGAPEASGIRPEAQPAAEPQREKTREELLQEDIEAKSYENTAVPPTDSNVLPRPKNAKPEEEPEEEERFTFAPDYTMWSIHFEDGSQRTFDSSIRKFVD